ncbi:MAG: sugar phosphate isomerase/epimerase [Gammaproteobacteria bacterium]|jgi:sugar phosphate isomerase/epimerase
MIKIKNTNATNMKLIEFHIHSFSMRYQFRYRNDFDVFSFIDFAKNAGFTGVNISANGPGYRDLSGTTESHFKKVLECLQTHSMKCELDTSDTSVENLTRMLDVAKAIGAEQLRVYTQYNGTLTDLIDWTVRDLRAVAPKAEALGINIVLENHEDFQGAALANILGQVNHPRIRALYDYGNSQMVAEEPMAALEAMIDYITCVHLKDHVVVEKNGADIIQGVPIGQGSLPIMLQTDRLYESGLRRYCFENVWGYVAPVVDGRPLPNTSAFSKNHSHQFLDANILSESKALAGELNAFETAWSWLQENLKKNGYKIQKNSAELTMPQISV